MNIETLYEEVVGDKEGSDAVEAIKESDKLSTSGSLRSVQDEPADYTEHDYSDKSLDELKTIFESNFSQVRELECYSTNDLSRMTQARDELYERGIVAVTEQVSEGPEQFDNEYEINYVEVDE